MTEWNQRDLEDLFVRRDVYERDRREFQEDLKKIERSLEWFTRLIISQGVILVVAIILFVIERLPAG